MNRWNAFHIAALFAATMHSVQADQSRFYRVASTQATRIVHWNQTGSLSWTNSDALGRIETTAALGSNWTAEVFLRRLDPSGTTNSVQLVMPGTNIWAELQTNPVINHGQTLDGMIWNDPCVIFENGHYRMWLSGGTGTGINHVAIHQADSVDGIHWTIDPSPVLEHGATAGDWDDKKVETPMVVKVGGAYHMYYSGFKTGDEPGRYQVGHAVSTNGADWIKDPANPILPYHNDPSKWGFYQTAEPGAAYDPQQGKMFLYYVTARTRPGGYAGDLALQQGIALATSTDGSTFTPYDPDGDGELDPVMGQSADYPVEAGYVGYSTPYVLIASNGVFHLVYDVARYVAPGDWRQVALARAVGTNGIDFIEAETNLFVYGKSDWKTHEVRAPCVLQEGNVFKMWFAGNNDLFFQPGFVIGIGCAVYGGDW